MIAGFLFVGTPPLAFPFLAGTSFMGAVPYIASGLIGTGFGMPVVALGPLQLEASSQSWDRTRACLHSKSDTPRSSHLLPRMRLLCLLFAQSLMRESPYSRGEVTTGVAILAPLGPFIGMVFGPFFGGLVIDNLSVGAMAYVNIGLVLLTALVQLWVCRRYLDVMVAE